MKQVCITMLSIFIAGSGMAQNTPVAPTTPLTISLQGSFAVGGSVITNPGTFNPITRTPEGQTFHGDHANITYQIPVQARKLPLVFWHGIGQFSKTWETTPDGREGFDNIFLRKGFGVYRITQPRRGNAGRSTVPATINPVPDEQEWFSTFRLGVWPDFFEGVQFDKSKETLNQYFRQMTPNIGTFDTEVITYATSELFNKIGEGILVTHSHSGGFGWLTAIRNDKIKAIVSYEPGSGFIFPEDEVPDPIPSSAGELVANGVPMDDFMKITQIPIVIYYGDFIPEHPSDNPGIDGWRVRLQMARLWRDVVNKHGGDVTVIHLPEIGIKGNTHFPFSDLNNIEIADLLSEWLKEKNLDLYAQQKETTDEKTKQELLSLSRQKWQWMSDKNIDSLNSLFHEEAVFIHMGGTMNKTEEINTIKNGGIHYKHAEIKETSIRFVGSTAIILDRIRLTAVVGGKEVVNPFMVTELYALVDGKWKLGSLSFTRLLGE